VSGHDPEIGFRPLVAADLALLATWLEADHVRPWWGHPAEEVQKVRDMLEGRDSTRPHVLLIDGRPAGYIQVWHLDDWRDEETLAGDPWVALLPEGAVGVDICIGERTLIDRGIGSRAVRLFSEGLAADGYATIIIDPDPANRRAVNAYARAGFRPIPTLLGKTEGVLIMRYVPGAPDRTS
jgi:RimJ/RimL family protein N-acetyltransferase